MCSSLDIPNKRDLVDSKLKELSIARQCELLTINRSMRYYQPKIMSLYNKKIMDRINEIYTDNPEYGYRSIQFIFFALSKNNIIAFFQYIYNLPIKVKHALIFR